MSEPVFIIGAGGHATVAAAVARAAGLEIAALFDAAAGDGRTVLGIAVLPMPDADWWRTEPRRAHIAIGDNGARERIAGEIRANWATFVHPAAVVHPTASIGVGVLIGASAVVQPEARIGDHAIINTGAIVEHHVAVGAYAHIAPGATLCGGVSVGPGTLVGAGATVIPTTPVGARAVVGAGSAVVSDVADGARVAGAPARSLGHG